MESYKELDELVIINDLKNIKDNELSGRSAEINIEDIETNLSRMNVHQKKRKGKKF
jgi:hypothetical protein